MENRKCKRCGVPLGETESELCDYCQKALRSYKREIFFWDRIVPVLSAIAGAIIGTIVSVMSVASTLQR